jgi:hypothetical protein
VFRSPRAGKLRVEIFQVFPECRSIGFFSQRVRAGANRVKFTGRFRGRRLPPGTYELRAADERIPVVVRKRRPPVRIRPDRVKSVCPQSTSTGAFERPILAGVSRTQPPGSPSPSVAPKTSEVAPPPTPAQRVLGVTEEIAESIAELHPAFFVLLALAIMLLAVASVPASAIPHRTAATAVAHRRIELTLAGALALGVVVAAYLVVLT